MSILLCLYGTRNSVYSRVMKLCAFRSTIRVSCLTGDSSFAAEDQKFYVLPNYMIRFLLCGVM